jgi:hypothetical protein
VDEAGLAEISLIAELMHASPVRVSATSPRIDGEAEAEVAMLTLLFADGRAARIDIALAESFERRETIVGCDGRTIVLDAFDARAPLRLYASGTRRAPQRSATWHESVSEHPSFESQDRLAVVAASFVAAARARDLDMGNALELAGAAAIWQAARRSMNEGGAMVDVARDESRRGELRLIKGRGRGGGGAAPALSIVESEPLGDGAA